MRRLVKSSSKNLDVLSLQANVQSCLDDVTSPAVGGRLIVRLALVTGTNYVSHGLGRRLTGWHTTRKRAQADVWDEQDSELEPERILRLVVDADVTVDLLVF